MLAGLGFKAGPGESKWHNTGVGAVWAVKRLLKRAIDFYAKSAEDWLQRVAKIIAQPGTEEAGMAPKAALNFGDKGEGARIIRAGKDIGDAGFTSRRPVSGVIQRGGKNTGGAAKEGKDTTSASPSDSRVKDITQPAITSFLTSGLLENGSKSSLPPSTDTLVYAKETFETSSEETVKTRESKERFLESNPSLIRLLGAEVRLTKASDNADQAKAHNSGSMHPQSLESNGATQAPQDEADTLPALCSGNSIKGIEDVKNSEVEVRKIGKSKKSKKGSDWSKDGGDKFYSLTEDSESTSRGCNESATVGSTLSESESASSAAESTVRQQRRQLRSTKIQPGLTGGAEPAGQSTKALKWDYLGIRLTGSENVPASDSPPNVDGNVVGQTSNTSATSTDTRLLQIIYDTIKEVQTETRTESRRARLATKHLQGTVWKIAKSCTEIEENLSTMEDRTTTVEADVEALKEQSEIHGSQLTDIMWKLEDYENRQKRNNLRCLGIEEGVEGNDIRAYMIKTLRDAFPELTKWDCETEIQRVHSFPIIRREGGRNAESKYPRTLLVFLVIIY
ncbi:hypothetical protein NDU88_005002 [Pleurodeles waltl]|uniref:Uncharacterized protein n=1 Tax=Pleurodeles waltl TaxID=8319 RepID=A0AAV7RN21_PLEWA|nr:hypothetical protein NDU88_005002 [Pleurodeles waltl]